MFEILSLTHSNTCAQGVLRDDEDLSLLGDDFKHAYQSRKVDLFDDDGW